MSRWLRQSLLLPCAVAASLAAAAQQLSPLEAHLAAARDAQAKANCHLAAEEYHAAVQLLPASGELRANEAIALFCDAQLEPAVTAFHAALHLKPSLSTPHLFLGFASFRLGKLETAGQELTLYLKQAPDDLTGRLWLGYTFAAQNRLPEAQAQFTQVLARDPGNLDAQYALGQSALDIAHDKARQLQSIDPSGVQLLRVAAQQYRAQGDTQRAQAAEDEAAKRSRSPAAATSNSPQATELANETEAAQAQALQAFQTILSTAPDSYRAHEVLADALLASHQEEAAIPEYQAALRLNPTLPGVHETYSECLVTTGRFAEALAALNAERALSPVASGRLLTRIGQAEHAMGKQDQAAQTLQDAVHHADAPPQAYLLLAQVLLAQGHADAAIPLLQHFLHLRPDTSTAFYTLSRAYRVLGNRPAMTQALADYQRTSEDAKARTLTAPLTQETPEVSFAANPVDAQATVPSTTNSGLSGVQ